MKKTRLISMLCAIAMALTLVLPVSAANMNDGYVENVIYVENGISRRITHEEYRNLMANKASSAAYGTIADIGITTMGVWDNWIFEVTSTINKLDTSLQTAVTPMVKGPATISTGETASFTTTYTVSGGISADALVAVNLQLSGSLSATTSRTFNVSFEVDSGRNARVCFTPMIKLTTGNLNHYSYTTQLIETKRVTANQPVKVGDFADGLYELIYQ